MVRAGAGHRRGSPPVRQARRLFGTGRPTEHVELRRGHGYRGCGVQKLVSKARSAGATTGSKKPSILPAEARRQLPCRRFPSPRSGRSARRRRSGAEERCVARPADGHVRRRLPGRCAIGERRRVDRHAAARRVVEEGSSEGADLEALGAGSLGEEHEAVTAAQHALDQPAAAASVAAAAGGSVSVPNALGSRCRIPQRVLRLPARRRVAVTSACDGLSGSGTG